MIEFTKQESAYFANPADPSSFSMPFSAAPHSDQAADPPDAVPGSLPGTSSLVHTQPSSAHESKPTGYRAFLTSGCRKQIAQGRALYVELGKLSGRDHVDRYDNCRSRAWFVRHLLTGEVRIASKRCHLRWCPLCLRVKRYIITQSVSAWLKSIVKPKFFTFTLRSSDDPLGVQIDRLYRYFRNIRRWPYWKKTVKGGVWFFQITFNKLRQQWHPHIHCLMDSEFFPQALLSEMWLTVTGSSDVVDVRAVKNQKEAADYVARYASCPTDLCKLDLERGLECALSLEHRRVYGKFGTGSDVQMSPKKCEDYYQWEELFSFSAVYNHRKTEPILLKIWQSWKTGTPCYVAGPDPPVRARVSSASDDSEPDQFKQLLFIF